MSKENTEKTECKRISVLIDGVEYMGFFAPHPITFSMSKDIDGEDAIGFFICNDRGHAPELLREMADSFDKVNNLR